MAFSSISDLWNKWNIRGILILSLSLQVFLILCASLRKKISNPHTIFLLWLAYLMADWVAAFGIGLISHSQGKLSAHATEINGALQAFWASFLLLHLGGPDTITAFSLEDSSLWQRHLLSLFFQISVAIYVFVQIFSSDKSLVILTMLVFLAGVIKNIERTLALYLSSLSRLKKSMMLALQGPREDAYSELFKDLKVSLCESCNEEKAQLAESIAVKHAYFFFERFKLFLSDLFYTNEERLMSHYYFQAVSAIDALRIISVELHFIYELLHTKVLTIRSKWGYIFRFIAFTEVAMAFVLFNGFEKHQLSKLDVAITYILLFGGISLDVITLSILIFSDWTIAEIMQYKTRSSRLGSFLHKLIAATDDLRKPRFVTHTAEFDANAIYMVLDTPFIFRRWSESISACNLFSELRKESLRKMYKHDQCWGITTFSNICSLPFHKTEKIISLFYQTHQIFVGRELSILAEIPRYTSMNPFTYELWVFIFKEVRRKSEDMHDPEEARKIFEGRGDIFLQTRWLEDLSEYVIDFTYDDSVILWHIATELLYNIENPFRRNDERKFSKILSDYMLYLLLNQPNVMSTVAGFSQMTLMKIMEKMVNSRFLSGDVEDVVGLCKSLFAADLTETWNRRDLLSEAIILAYKMESLGEAKWTVMSKVWVEMLLYAAGHIKGEAHAQVLSKGGELLAFVWLLMAHFGCLCKLEWSSNERYVFGRQMETDFDDDNGDQEEDDESTVVAELV